MSVIRFKEWSLSGLIEAIQENALLPENQQTFTQANYLRFLNVESESRVVPWILGLNESYFLKVANIPIIQSNSTALATLNTNSSGPNVAYQLPADAVGKKMVDVAIINSNGSFLSLPLLTTYQLGSPTQVSFGFWIGGDQIYLYPASQFTSVNTIQITYPGAPLALCDDTSLAPLGSPSSAEVTAINYTTGLITVATVPAAFTVGAAVNFVAGMPQFSTEAVTTITAVAGDTITVDPTVLKDFYNRPTVTVGSWVANAGYSPFLQMPGEARNLVVQATVVKVLRALKDVGAKVAKQDYDELISSSLKIFSPRVDDSPRILSTYGRGVGAWRRFGGWGKMF